MKPNYHVPLQQSSGLSQTQWNKSPDSSMTLEESDHPAGKAAHFDQSRSFVQQARHRRTNLLLLGSGHRNDSYWKALSYGRHLYQNIVIIGSDEHSPVGDMRHQYVVATDIETEIAAAQSALQRLGKDAIVLNLHESGEVMKSLLNESSAGSFAFDLPLGWTSAELREFEPFASRLHPVHRSLFSQGALSATEFCLRRKSWVRRVRRIIGTVVLDRSEAGALIPRRSILERQRQLLAFVVQLLRIAGEPFWILPEESKSGVTPSDKSPRPMDAGSGSLRPARFHVEWNNGADVHCELRQVFRPSYGEQSLQLLGESDQLLGDIDLSPDGFIPHLRILEALQRPRIELGPSFEDERKIATLLNLNGSPPSTRSHLGDTGPVAVKRQNAVENGEGVMETATHPLNVLPLWK